MTLTPSSTAPEISNAIRAALGAAPTDLEFVPTGEPNTVYRARADGRRVIFKAHAEDDIVLEAWAYGAARAAGVLVPQVLAFDTTRSHYPEPFVVLEQLDGRPMEERGADPDTAREIGRQLALLHTVAVEGFGGFDPESLRGGVARGRHSSEREVVAYVHQVYGLPYLRARGLLPDSAAARLDSMVGESLSLFDRDVPVLLHNDLAGDHVFVDDDLRVTGIIDFGDARAGDPVWDFACFSVHEPELVPAMIEGYGDAAAAPPEKLAACRVMRLLWEVQWLHERAFDVSWRLARLRALART